MAYKTDKEIFFEKMHLAGGMPLNENIVNEGRLGDMASAAIKTIAQQLNITNWSSPQGKAIRQTVLQKLGGTVQGLERILTSSISTKEKAKKAQQLLNVPLVTAVIFGVRGLITNTERVAQEVARDGAWGDFMRFLGGEGTQTVHHMEYGGTFWLVMLVSLLALKLAIYLLNKGKLGADIVRSEWDSIKATYRGNLEDAQGAGTDGVKPAEEIGENYPLGAANDPSAPWNESDPLEFKGYEIEWYNQNPNEFKIRVESDGYGYKEFDGFELVDNSSDEEVLNYFEDMTLTPEIVNSPEFAQMVDRVFNEVVDVNEIEWDGEADDGYDPDERYDDIEEDISIDVNVGDTIMTGKFKNSRTVVKSIGKDEHGMPTINGKKVVTFRKGTEDKAVNELSGAPEERTALEITKTFLLSGNDPLNDYKARWNLTNLILKQTQTGVDQGEIEALIDDAMEELSESKKLKQKNLLFERMGYLNPNMGKKII